MVTQPLSPQDEHDLFISTVLNAWRADCVGAHAISPDDLQRLQRTITELLRVALQGDGVTLQELRVFAAALLRRPL